MPTKEEIIATIDRAYDARLVGDKATLDTIWAPGGTFRLAGDASLRRHVPNKPEDRDAAVGELVDLFKYHGNERLDVLVDGDKAAVRWRIEVSAHGKPQVSSEIFELWTFAEDGKVQGLIQFADTALISKLVS